MSFLRYSLQTGFVRVFLMCASTVSGIINARWLGPEGVGICALLGLIPILSFRFGNLGFGSAFTFFVAKKKITVRKALKLTWLIGLSMAAVMCLVLFAVWRHEFSPWHDIAHQLFYITLPTVPMYFVSSYLLRVLSAQLRITVINISEVINTFMFVLLVFLFVVVLKLGVMGSVLAFVVSQYAVLLFLAMQFLRRWNKSASIDETTGTEPLKIMDLWRYSQWNYLIMLTNILFEDLPMLFLKYFGSNKLIGLFTMGQNLSRKPRLVVDPFATMLFPFTASSEANDAVQRTNMLCRNILLLMLFLLIILCVIAKPLILLLYGESFLPAVTVFYVIMPVILLYPLNQFLTVHIAASGNPKVMFLTNLVGLVSVVVLCWSFVPVYGMVGAAISVSATHMVMVAVRAIVYVRCTGAKLAEVILFQKSDLLVYRDVLKKIASWIFRRKQS